MQLTQPAPPHQFYHLQTQASASPYPNDRTASRTYNKTLKLPQNGTAVSSELPRTIHTPPSTYNLVIRLWASHFCKSSSSDSTRRLPRGRLLGPGGFSRLDPGPQRPDETTTFAACGHSCKIHLFGNVGCGLDPMTF